MKKSKKRILVADDEQDTRNAVKDILQSRGYDVITASNGKDCLKKLKKEKVNLLVLDIMMPVLDGWQVVRSMKKDKRLRRIPIVVLTVKSGKEDYEMAREARIRDYITKPFDMDNLISRVRRNL